MALVHVGGRVPEAYAIQLKSIQAETGKSESELVREAIAHYLGKTSSDSVAQMATRLATVESQLVKMQKLFLGVE